jgi:hypothetical protein
MRRLKDMLTDRVMVGPDDVIDIGAVRDVAGHYRRATTTLRDIAGFMLDELAARGVPIPPVPEPSPEPPAPAPPPERGMTPLVARVLERHQYAPPREDTVYETFGSKQRRR